MLSAGTPDGQPGPLEVLRSRVAPVTWEWRVELAAGIGTFLMAKACFAVLDDAGTVAVMVGIGLLLWRCPGHRAIAVEALRRSAVRRQWSRAARLCGLVGPHGHRPTVQLVRPTAAGDRLHVRIPLGCPAALLEQNVDALAAAMGVMEVRVARHVPDASYVDVLVVRRNPLLDMRPVPWPAVNAERMSLWEPVPVGVDEDGYQVKLLLPERNVLVGGEPGAGKSALLSLLVAAAALDPTVRLTVLDGKLVELAAWRDCATTSVGPTVAEAVDVLGSLGNEMAARYTDLLAAGLRKVSAGDGLPLHVIVIDELAYYLQAPDKNERNAFAALLRDLVARGRAAGFIVIAATQKPSSDVIPTSIRDLFSFRAAMRCSTPQASDTILGQGWATQGYSASTIDPTARGVGLLLHEGGLPTRFRACYLDDDTVTAVADRAAALRAEASHG